jgi:hypothetical protein
MTGSEQAPHVSLRWSVVSLSGAVSVSAVVAGPVVSTFFTPQGSPTNEAG